VGQALAARSERLQLAASMAEGNYVDVRFAAERGALPSEMPERALERYKAAWGRLTVFDEAPIEYLKRRTGGFSRGSRCRQRFRGES
jgi:hypothetical protein